MTPREELEVLGKDLAMTVRELRQIHRESSAGQQINALWKNIQQQMAAAYEEHWRLLSETKAAGLPIPKVTEPEPVEKERSGPLDSSAYSESGIPILHPEFADSGSMDEAAATFLKGMQRPTD